MPTLSPSRREAGELVRSVLELELDGSAQRGLEARDALGAAWSAAGAGWAQGPPTGHGTLGALAAACTWAAGRAATDAWALTRPLPVVLWGAVAGLGMPAFGAGGYALGVLLGERGTDALMACGAAVLAWMANHAHGA